MQKMYSWHPKRNVQKITYATPKSFHIRDNLSELGHYIDCNYSLRLKDNSLPTPILGASIPYQLFVLCFTQDIIH